MAVIRGVWCEWYLGAALTVACLCCGACDSNPETYPVTGNVVFPDGTPLTAGTVSFRSAESSPAIVARGKIGTDGSFTMSTFATGDGCVEGKHQVLVAPEVPRDTDNLQGAALELAMTGGIDPRYASYETSDLTAQVTSDATQNMVRLVVTPPGR